MMGFGGMGMTVPWLFGVVALATIWAGVWWMLSAVGITPPRRHVPPPAPAAMPATTTWEQPQFDASGPATPAATQEPDLLRSESEHR